MSFRPSSFILHLFAMLRLGTRASALARWQAEWVAAQIEGLGTEVELVPITTQGDVKSGPLSEIGGQGLFTKELERALLAKQIDLAVHSLKDLPTTPVDGLTIAAVPERESTADVLITNVARDLAGLPKGARVGTGSLRRQAQLLNLRPDLVVSDIRGNVETRLRKLDDGEYEAIMLAEAGLSRLGLNARMTQVLPSDVMLPAVGQGALGIEARKDDQKTLALLAPLNHDQTQACVAAERSLLAALRAGCIAPVGALGQVAQGRLSLEAVVLSSDGRQRLAASGTAPVTQAEQLGRQVAEQLLAQGASELILAARSR
jgi:hydroxymethylbilane synthase